MGKTGFAKLLKDFNLEEEYRKRKLEITLKIAREHAAKFLDIFGTGINNLCTEDQKKSYCEKNKLERARFDEMEKNWRQNFQIVLTKAFLELEKDFCEEFGQKYAEA